MSKRIKLRGCSRVALSWHGDTLILEGNFKDCEHDSVGVSWPELRAQMSVRARNFLCGVESVDKLLSMSDTDILNIVGCGPITLKEIRALIGKYGLSLMGDTGLENGYPQS